MTRNHSILAALVVAAVGLLVVGAPVDASNAIAEKTGIACTVCHDKPGSKLMTDKGKYWEAVGTLDGFDEIQERLAECTDCHVKKPGSKKLTETGKRYQWIIQDMDGLKSWLMERHPATLSTEPTEEPGEPEDGR